MSHFFQIKKDINGLRLRFIIVTIKKIPILVKTMPLFLYYVVYFPLSTIFSLSGSKGM